jgi:hypothetical protein
MRKNLNKIPEQVMATIAAIPGNEVVVATVLKVSQADLLRGRYRNLGLGFEDGALVFEPSFVPNPAVGRYAKANTAGKTIVRKDLPKVYKTIYMGERPIFGDWSKGSFSLNQTRHIYQKQFKHPRYLAVSIELLDTTEESGEKLFTVTVSVDEVLDKASTDFEERLLFNLNVLQEATYSADVSSVSVFAANATVADYLKTLNVAWEIFPPGERDRDLERILSTYSRVTEETKRQIRERYDLLFSIKPTPEIILGASGVRKYFGARFAPDLAVFENLEYGNALYVMYENWTELSKLSRTEVLNRPEKDYTRIEHKRGWENRLKQVVASKLGDDGTPPEPIPVAA